MQTHLNGNAIQAAHALRTWMTYCEVRGWDMEEAASVWRLALTPNGEEQRDMLIDAGIEVTH